MIPFFRKIRYQLAKNNQFFKYSRYAIGEIVLVVVGILIALQINNWNEERKTRKAEKVLLSNLRSDFLYNQTELKNFLEFHEGTTSHLKGLLKSLGPKLMQEKTDSINYAIASALWVIEYEPKSGAINSIFSSGEITKISNQELVDILNKWKSELANYNRIASYIREENITSLNPYLTKHYPFKNWAVSVGANVSKASKHEFPIDKMLQSPEFENLILLRTINADELAKKTKELFKIQTKLIALINSEINKN